MRIYSILGCAFAMLSSLSALATSGESAPLTPPPPPINDECANAIPLTVSTTTCSFTQYTNAQATASAGVPAPGCASYSGGDVWFKAVVPATGRLVIDTQTGVMTDGGMAIYSGTCGSLTLIECDDDDSNNGLMPMIDKSGLTPGATIYIRVWEYSNDNLGTFSICAYSPPPPPGCFDSDPFCTNSSYLFPASTNVSDMGEVGCLYTTPNPAWYWMQIANPGDLHIHISSSADVDFIAWGPFPSLAAACATDLMSNDGVDCSYSTAAAEDCDILGVQTGQVYVLLITNYANVETNISFSQTSGSATTNCGIVAPPITNNGPLCVGQTLELTVSSPTPGATYSWTGPNGFTSNVMNPTISNITTAAAGVYSLVITVGGVTSPPVTTTLVVNLSPVATAGSNSPVCSGNVLNLTSSGGTSYSWSGPNSFTGTTQNPSMALVATSAAGTYTVTVSGTGGCTSTAQTTVVINQTPAPTATNNGPLCAGNTLNLTSLPAGATSYAWSGPNAYTSTVQNPSITSVTTSASGIYTVTVTGLGGCTATTTTTLVVNGSSVFVPTSNSPICENQTLNLSVPVTGNSYSWSGPNGFTSTLQNPTITNSTVAASGLYQVTVTSTGGCTSTGSLTVAVNPLPIVTIIGDTTICSGKSTTLTASGGDSYLWSNGQNFTNINVSPTTQTTYTVTATSAQGCVSIGNKTVYVDENPVIDNIATTNELCNKANGEAVATVSLGLPPYQYSWSNSGPNSATNSMIGSGNYSVIVTDANGCTTTAPFSIQNTPGPELSITSVNHDHCNQGIGSATVIAANVPGNYTYHWLTEPQQQGITANGLTAGTYLAVVTDNTCYDTLAVVISNIPGPFAKFEPSPGLANSTNASIRFINQTEGSYSSLWSFGDGTTSTFDSPIHEYLQSDTFTVILQVTDTYGCVDTTLRTVIIYDDINVFIPNAFSPNEDGINEVFKPYGRGINFTKPYEMLIYDRWGKMVFSSSKFEEGWDGHINGAKIKSNSTFIYRITLYDFSNKKHVYKGSFSLFGSKSDGDF